MKEKKKEEVRDLRHNKKKKMHPSTRKTIAFNLFVIIFSRRHGTWAVSYCVVSDTETRIRANLKKQGDRSVSPYRIRRIGGSKCNFVQLRIYVYDFWGNQIFFIPKKQVGWAACCETSVSPRVVNLTLTLYMIHYTLCCVVTKPSREFIFT